MYANSSERRRGRVYDTIRGMIESGSFCAGERLPSERALAREYGVNRMIAKNILQKLSHEGYVYRVHGKGTFAQSVRREKPDLGILSPHGTAGVSAVLKDQGIRFTNEIIAKGTVQGDRFLASRFGLDEGACLCGLHRVRLGDGVPLAVEYTYIPRHLFHDFEATDFAALSLYGYMAARGYKVVGGRQQIRVVRALEKQAALGVEVGQPVYYVEFLGVTRGGETVEYTECYSRPDTTQLRFMSRVAE